MLAITYRDEDYSFNHINEHERKPLMRPKLNIDPVVLHLLNRSPILSFKERQKLCYQMITNNDPLVQLIRLVVSKHNCLACFEPKSDYLTQCSHTFHRKCIETWTNFVPGQFIKLGRSCCPVCRHPINPSLYQMLVSDSKQQYRICIKCETPFPAGSKRCVAHLIAESVNAESVNENIDDFPDTCRTCNTEIIIIRCPECDNALEHDGGCRSFICCQYGTDRCQGYSCDHGSKGGLMTYCGHRWNIDIGLVRGDCGHCHQGYCDDCYNCDDCCDCERADCDCRDNGKCEECGDCNDCCSCERADCDCRNNGKCEECGDCNDCCSCERADCDCRGNGKCDECGDCYGCCSCECADCGCYNRGKCEECGDCDKCCDCEGEKKKCGDCQYDNEKTIITEYCVKCQSKTVRYKCGCRIQIGVHKRSMFECVGCEKCLSCCNCGN